MGDRAGSSPVTRTKQIERFYNRSFFFVKSLIRNWKFNLQDSLRIKRSGLTVPKKYVKMTINDNKEKKGRK